MTQEVEFSKDILTRIFNRFFYQSFVIQLSRNLKIRLNIFHLSFNKHIWPKIKRRSANLFLKSSCTSLIRNVSKIANPVRTTKQYITPRWNFLHLTFLLPFVIFHEKPPLFFLFCIQIFRCRENQWRQNTF